VRITRFPALSEQQFLGCMSAFSDSFTGELNSAMLALRRLQGMAKGAGFAFEMTLDSHRYGALIVLDRWAQLVRAFGPHLSHEALETAALRIQSAEKILTAANQILDAAGRYGEELVEGCGVALQSATAMFDIERRQAAKSAALGPMLPEDYRTARQIFLEDLAAR
jgi:hypothetical protein